MASIKEGALLEFTRDDTFFRVKEGDIALITKLYDAFKEPVMGTFATVQQWTVEYIFVGSDKTSDALVLNIHNHHSIRIHEAGSQ